MHPFVSGGFMAIVLSLIYIVVIVYLIGLVTRLVKAVERIANKMNP
jgi:hypothetical protein